MSTTLALIFILIGGIVNGSFALPTKYIRQWNFENIWLNFSIWGFLLAPWIVILLLAPQAWAFYQNISAHTAWTILIGGLIFGIGQICFAQALSIIGLGLGFVINIGLGTALGFFLPLALFHPEKILTSFGYTTLIGIALILLGLIISYLAGKQRDHYRRHQQLTISSSYQLGVILAVIAGIASAVQNFTFAATIQLQTMALQAGFNHLASAMIIWPIFLTASFIPYTIYMGYLHHKNNSYRLYQKPRTAVNCFLTLMMGLAFFLSLVLYSQASLLIGSLGPIVGWPMFMVLIILTSFFWGWRHHEWAHVPLKIQRQALSAIGILILAVGVLAYSATLT